MKSVLKNVYAILFLLAIQASSMILKYEPPPCNSTYSNFITFDTLEQKVNHFDPTDTRTWDMIFAKNNQFFRNGGPIIIFLGGEWDIQEGCPLVQGHVPEIANDLGGYMFYTEHRYYGHSYPKLTHFRDRKYLSVDQALADVIYFIKHVKETVKELTNSKVIVVGCSYAGSMATWIREKYPHVVHAAYASSGPVKAVVEFPEYFEVVGESIGMVSQECLKIVEYGMAQLFQNYKDIPSRFRKVKDLVGVISGNVQYGNIENICQILKQHKGQPFEKLLQLLRFESQYNIDDPDHISWKTQTCNEFGWFQTTKSKRQPFGQVYALDEYYNACREINGENFEDILYSGGNRTNLFYGSKKPQITKLVSVHGSRDPWHTLGILEDLNALAPAIVINGTYHCSDLHSKDYPGTKLKEAKAHVRKLLAEWIKD